MWPMCKQKDQNHEHRFKENLPIRRSVCHNNNWRKRSEDKVRARKVGSLAWDTLTRAVVRIKSAEVNKVFAYRSLYYKIEGQDLHGGFRNPFELISLKRERE